jgi:hypothetical protein
MRKYSIIQDDLTQCYVCRTTQNIHIHHIFFAANRKKSEKHHCIAALCYYHHNGSNRGVHFNKKLDLELKQLAQAKFEETHTREEFRAIFGKSWL